jgi:hypothetical protein
MPGVAMAERFGRRRPNLCQRTQPTQRSNRRFDHPGKEWTMSIVRRLRLLLVPLVAFFAVAGVTGATASPPTSGSGTMTTTAATLANPRTDGGNTTYDVTATVEYTGTFTGTSLVRGTLTFHANGSANAKDVETFTGTVNGTPGTVTFHLVAGNDPDGTYEGTDVVISATGGLAGLHSRMTQLGTIGANGPVGTYTSQLQFGKP